jgi:hypothetical protein
MAALSAWDRGYTYEGCSDRVYDEDRMQVNRGKLKNLLIKSTNTFINIAHTSSVRKMDTWLTKAIINLKQIRTGKGKSVMPANQKPE